MKKIFLLILLVFFTISCAGKNKTFSRQIGENSQSFYQGMEALHNFMLEDARSYFSDIIEKDSSCASCLLNLSFAEPDVVLKRNYLNQALNLSKENHPETMLIRNALQALDNTDLSPFSGYLELYNKYPADSYLAAGAFRELQSQDKLQQGRNLLKKAAEKSQKGHLYNLLAYSYMWYFDPMTSEYDQALEYLDQYIALEPSLANPLDSKGEFYLNKGDTETAIRYYTQASIQDPNFEWSKKNIALAKYQQLFIDGNAKTMSFSSENAEALNQFNVGRWNLYNLNWEQAVKDFSNAIDLDPSFAYAYLLRARTKQFLNQDEGIIQDDLDAAQSFSINASKEESNLIDAFIGDNTVGSTNFIKLSEELSDKYYDDSLMAFETVFATISTVGPERVLERAKALYEMNPSFTPSLNMIGYAYLRLENYNKAKNAFQEQIRSAPASANPYDSMGDYYLAVNNDELAFQYFQHSSKLGLEASSLKADSLQVLINKKNEKF